MSHCNLVDQYVESCKTCGAYPSKLWTQQFFNGNLTIDISKLDEADVEVLSHSINKTETPHFISIVCSKSTHNENKLFFKKILKALARCLQVSRSLKQVSFIDCNLYTDYLSIICQGLKKAESIDTLTFNKCKFSVKFSGLESVCSAIKNVPSIGELSLVNCGLHAEDAITIKKLIVHQSMNRTTFMWHETLRFQEAELDSYVGLRHLILNDNPSFGDDGLDSIISALTDDIWITGIEFENCGIQTEGGKNILQLLKTNEIINLTNIDRNPFVDKSIAEEIAKILEERRDREWNPQDNRIHLPENNVEDNISTNSLREVIGQKKELCSRLIGKRQARNFMKKRIQSASPMRSAVPELKEGSDWEQVYLLLFREMRERLQSELNHERQLRMKTERKLEKREQKIRRLKERLDSRFLMDENTINNIENSFSMFQQFLINLQETEDNKSPSLRQDQSLSDVDSLHKIVSDFLGKLAVSGLRKCNKTDRNFMSRSDKTIIVEATNVSHNNYAKEDNLKLPILESSVKPSLPQEQKAAIYESIELLNKQEITKENKDLSKHKSGSNFLDVNHQLDNILFQKKKDSLLSPEPNAASSVLLPDEEYSNEISYESEDVSSDTNKPDDSKVSGNLLNTIKLVTFDEAEISNKVCENQIAMNPLQAPSETDEDKLKLLESRSHPHNSPSPSRLSLSNHSSYTDVLTEDFSGVEDLSITTLSSL